MSMNTSPSAGLRRAGLRTRRGGSANALLSIPVFGVIPAGFPANGDQRPDAVLGISADTLHLPQGTRTFAVRVRGDSMTGAGILDGDSIILEFRDPAHGDIVAALIDGEKPAGTYALPLSPDRLRAARGATAFRLACGDAVLVRFFAIP